MIALADAILVDVVSPSEYYGEALILKSEIASVHLERYPDQDPDLGKGVVQLDCAIMLKSGYKYVVDTEDTAGAKMAMVEIWSALGWTTAKKVNE